MSKQLGIFVVIGAVMVGVATALGFNRASVTTGPVSGQMIDWSIFSEFYTPEQMQHSDTAVANNIPNVADAAVYQNAQIFAQQVLDLMTHFLQMDSPGMLLKINSWYRSPNLNAAVGGSDTSDHPTGSAADINTSQGISPILRAVYDWYIPFDQLIIYPTYVHISYDVTKSPGDQKRQVMIKTSSGYQDVGYEYLASAA